MALIRDQGTYAASVALSFGLFKENRIMKRYIVTGILLLLVCCIFATQNIAAKIGDREYSETEFEQGFAAYLEYQRLPQELSKADSLALYERYFEELIAKYIYDHAIKERGIQLSLYELEEMIRAHPPKSVQSIPELLTDGQFDQAKYEQALKERTDFKLSIMEYARAIYEYRKLLDTIRAEATIDEDAIKSEWLAQTQTADAQIIYFDYTKLDSIQVDEAEMREYYQDNILDYKRENGRSLYFVRFAGASSREDFAKLDEMRAKSDSLYLLAKASNLPEAAQQMNLTLQESQMFSPQDLIIRGIGREPDLIQKAFAEPVGTVLEPQYNRIGDIFVCQIAQSAEEYYIPFEVVRGTLELRLRSIARQAAMKKIVHEFIHKYHASEYLDAAQNMGLTVIEQTDISLDSQISGIGKVDTLTKTILSTPENSFSPLIENNGFFYLAYVQKHNRRSEEDWQQHKDEILEQAWQEAQNNHLDNWYRQQKSELDILYPQKLQILQR